MASGELDRLAPPPFWRTRYFALVVMTKPGRRQIDLLDIRTALEQPVRKERQSDGRERYWTWISSQTTCLRVVTLADGDTVHNAFYDRDFEP